MHDGRTAIRCSHVPHDAGPIPVAFPTATVGLVTAFLVALVIGLYFSLRREVAETRAFPIE